MSGYIREFDTKRLLNSTKNISTLDHILIDTPPPHITLDEYLSEIYDNNKWLSSSKGLVVKPDVLLKRRGKEGLILLNASWEEVTSFLKQHIGSSYQSQSNGVKGYLTHFLIEPYLPHQPNSEFYFAIRTTPNSDQVLFSSQGGINVGDVESHASKLDIPLIQYTDKQTSYIDNDSKISSHEKLTNGDTTHYDEPSNLTMNNLSRISTNEDEEVKKANTSPHFSMISNLILKNSNFLNQLQKYQNPSSKLTNSTKNESKIMSSFIQFVDSVHQAFCQFHMSYLEINPLVYDEQSNTFYPLDAAARLDPAAEYLCETLWHVNIPFQKNKKDDISQLTNSQDEQNKPTSTTPYVLFPPPFGRSLTPEEKFIKDLDNASGASLKLTVINPMGRIWTMIAGGGASVVYTDTICELGYHKELANYGEYSGAPTENATYSYAKTVLSLVTAEGTYREEGKCLFLGGGIANFTSIVDTFKGIISAIRDFQYKLHEYKVKIFVRRGGPNYQDGLKMMREVCEQLNIPTRVFGPETYMTDIITLYLDDGFKEPDQIQANGSSSQNNSLVTPNSDIEKHTKHHIHTQQNHTILTQSIHNLKKRILSNGQYQNTSSQLSPFPQNKKPVHSDESNGSSVGSFNGNKDLQESWHETHMEDVEKDPNFVRQVETILVEQGKLRDSKDSMTPPNSPSSLPSPSHTFVKPINFEPINKVTLTHDPSPVPGGSVESLTPTLSDINNKYVDSSTISPQIQTIHSLQTSQWFTKTTCCFVWGLQTRAVQEMLDFDHVCGRQTPSVAAIIYEFSVSHLRPFYFGTEEIFIPICQTLEEAVLLHGGNVSVLVNFASFRSAASVVFQALSFPATFPIIATIAEGIPERLTREMNVRARELSVNLIGPATVGGIKPGAFRIGNTGGTLENIMNAKLYRGGSVSVVTKSGGMLNELNNLMSQKTDGVCEAVAIGGDRFPGTTMVEHALRFQKNEETTMIVVLGELGGNQEYLLGKAILDGRITKPVVCWCVGTCAKLFSTEVTFGHAGAWAGGEDEQADSKNKFLRSCGAIVPYSYHYLGEAIEFTYKTVSELSKREPFKEPAVPRVPMDYAWAKKLGLVRKPKGFVSSISDDRGEELLYAGWPVSKVVESGIMGVGGVISLLWFKRPLPEYCYRYLERVLMLTADHGPAVCGAHNTIVTARAGKDLISSLISGLCTIGDRFGGACDMAAHQFLSAYKRSITPEEFVKEMRLHNKLVMGIGHKIKSANNPDMRVELLYQFCKQHFIKTDIIDYAKAVEKITTKKKNTLILNVDGLIGASMCDMLYSCEAFTEVEAMDYIENGCINGLFVLGRSIGFIGHFLDQKRLKQGLYRHDVDDISYVLPDVN